ncbi:MAG: hypothetical protein JXB29_03370 [Sedimentisphaerales bacterium]|nr:hypothetical protein [Sedimentisphaerales bacterium]
MKNKLSIKNCPKGMLRYGSALILTVVLTSLLAIVGVMFVMAARVDKMATSAISENKQLNYAIESLVTKISQELTLDVPGVNSQEYYDYPGPKDKWLASLEPYEKDPNDYRWRQISAVEGYISGTVGWTNSDQNDIKAEIIVDYPEIEIDDDGHLDGQQRADADGDGVADSKWIELEDITSTKGKPIFAAVRIVDNGGMINVNTAYKFEPADANLVDGSSQLQVNLAALARSGDSVDDIEDARNPSDRPMSEYERDVIWRLEDPCANYEPFDISDELELRNRFLCTSLTEAKIERDDVWNGTLDAGGGTYAVPEVPIRQGAVNLTGWQIRMDPTEDKYERRHLLSTYNFDRIIDPNGGKMLNINDANTRSLYSIIKTALADPNFDDNGRDANQVAAQIAVNLVDFRDENSNVTKIPVGATNYYGFETPCIYISELAHKFEPDAINPGIIHKSYAIELYKPCPSDAEPNNWRLVVNGNSISIDGWTSGKQFYVILNNDPAASLLPIDPNAVVDNSNTLVFDSNTTLHLQRPLDVNDVNYITIDSKLVPKAIPKGWLAKDANKPRSIQRDITLHKCIRGLWDPNAKIIHTLGRDNDYNKVDSIYIQAHPANEKFTNVGEIGTIFRKCAYSEGPSPVGSSDTEADVRVDLADPNYQKLFKYLTVFDPASDNIDNDGDGHKDSNDVFGPEWKVPGRININTAPWFVMAQLPWVSPELAQAIADYRDKTSVFVDYSSRTGEPGFENIGQLNNVIDKGSRDYRIDYYSRDTNDLDGFPDLTPSDAAINDFEERDVIFARISNLVTVRSDVFTAYILVRIGSDGPQKRAIAILDRSNVYTAKNKVRIVALHPVPDPR